MFDGSTEISAPIEIDESSSYRRMLTSLRDEAIIKYNSLVRKIIFGSTLDVAQYEINGKSVADAPDGSPLKNMPNPRPPERSFEQSEILKKLKAELGMSGDYIERIKEVQSKIPDTTIEITSEDVKLYQEFLDKIDQIFVKMQKEELGGTRFSREEIWR